MIQNKKTNTHTTGLVKLTHTSEVSSTSVNEWGKVLSDKWRLPSPTNCAMKLDNLLYLSNTETALV